MRFAAVHAYRAWLFRRRGRFSLAGIAKNEKSPLFVVNVDVSSRVHQYVLGRGRQFCWSCSNAFGGLRRNKPAGFLWVPRVLDIEDSQPGVEISEIDQIGLFLHVGKRSEEHT